MQEVCFYSHREHDVEIEEDEDAENNEDRGERPWGAQSQKGTLALIVAAQENTMDLTD